MKMVTTLQLKTNAITDANGYQYQTVENDPYNVRIYTLKNGLEVFLSQNFDAPRIQTFIPVKTGSNNDPADNTGLSHYLEHMMFKGTSKIGTQNWNEEKKYLDQIEDLYELHKIETNPKKKEEIYRQIDAISQEASKFAIANEYDKLISSIGAIGTNAHTWLDETVYKNNIPKNELERWLKVEQERFSELVLRLFHTELESVYEEFNRAQDNDSRLVNYALMEALFPNHPNGQQTTLGKAEHLKNPSMKAIYKYFSDYYVPNNYAMILVGDLDFEETIQLIDQYFGAFEFKELPSKPQILEQPQTSIIKKILKSPTIPRVQIAWRTDSFGSKEAILADVVANILSNKGEAGLIDININQKQTALYAQAYSVGFKQYGYFSAVIVTKESQTLDQGIQLLLEQINLVKKGDFEDWLISAIVKDFKAQRLKGWETAEGLATTLYDSYIKGRTWEEELAEMSIYESITKDDIVDFAQNFFKENYVVVYKEKGTNENLIRVDNPGITPIEINREAQSLFLENFMKEEPKFEIQPEFVDYQKEIQTIEIKGKKLSFVKNKYNDLAQVHFIFPFGSDHDIELGLATQVLQYLGTDQFSAEKLRQEFYKIGINHDFITATDQLTISLNGLEENISSGIQLLEHWLLNAIPDSEAYQNYVKTILESREATKKDKTRIMNALVSYAKNGPFSRQTDIISAERLANLDVNDLTNKIKNLLKQSYQIFFYGNNFDQFQNDIQKIILPETISVPSKREYPIPSQTNTVYFTNYDMVQMEMTKIGKGKDVNPENFAWVNVFNEYFGRGLSSIVFQEIRESKSLAYSAYVAYQTNVQLDFPDYVSTYIGTQPDKLGIAVETMNQLMSELPQIPLQFENARNAVIKQIASTRVTRTNIFFNTLRLEKIGIYHDYRKDIYDNLQTMTLKSLVHFYDNRIRPIVYNTAIIGKKENLNMNVIEKIGTYKELSLEEIFGF